MDLSVVVVVVVMVTSAVSFDIELESGLKMDYIGNPETCDRVAVQGNILDLHYIGYLESGDKFDSSYDRQQPVKFVMGSNQVIKGWEEGVMGMCVGEKRRLVIPPALGYGDQGYGTVPGDATLTFDVELIDAMEPPKPVNVFQLMDTNVDGGISRDELNVYLTKQAETMQDDEDAKKLLAGPPYLQNRVEEIFFHEDVDKDGFISHDEFKGPKHDELPKPPNIFKQVDSNNDLVISRDELSNYLKQEAEAMEGDEAKKILEEKLYLNQVEDIFAHEDNNKDGFISHEEFKGPKHDEL